MYRGCHTDPSGGRCTGGCHTAPSGGRCAGAVIRTRLTGDVPGLSYGPSDLPTGPMVYWSLGPLVSWSTGPLALWSLGLLVTWSTSPLVHWSLGPLVHWSTGPLVCWSLDLLVCWSTGPLVHGSTDRDRLEPIPAAATKPSNKARFRSNKSLVSNLPGGPRRSHFISGLSSQPCCRCFM